jgi:hypothetical protein
MPIDEIIDLRNRNTAARAAFQAGLGELVGSVSNLEAVEPDAFAWHCPRRSFDAPAPRSDWREVQANMGMASLLMPRELFDSEATAAWRGEVDSSRR